jgi:ribosomal protein S6--L-glutamate ligase
VAEAVIETLQWTKQNVLIQRFISESRGRDVRALVVGDQVIAAMRRIGIGDEFRSNVHRGGRTEPVELDEQSKKIAVRAAHTMGLRIAGVDMLEGADGPLVMEVNSSPGLEGIEGATHLDVAGTVIDYVASQVDFPDLDVRQRLANTPGYGVAELYVGPGADLIDQTIRSGLRDRDISVLTLFRSDNVIPNPREDRVLEEEDRLLCFGKLSEMRMLIPARRRRRARPMPQPLPDDPLLEDPAVAGESSDRVTGGAGTATSSGLPATSGAISVETVVGG